jgi:hypothetical protein
MTIDEAIKHAEEVAEKQKSDWAQCPRSEQEPKCSGLGICTIDKSDGCLKSAEEHRQVAEWLKELKMYKKALDQELILLDNIRAKIEQEIVPRESLLYDREAVWQNSGLRKALEVIDKYKAESESGMKDLSDVLIVSYDNNLKDESALCVSRKQGDKIIMLKMELGERADILYRLLTEQMTTAEINVERESMECTFYTSPLYTEPIIAEIIPIRR